MTLASQHIEMVKKELSSVDCIRRVQTRAFEPLIAPCDQQFNKKLVERGVTSNVRFRDFGRAIR
jgi:hypothetical protein